MTTQNSYKSMTLPSAEYVRLQQLMHTMIGSRTVLASILRRKLGAAAPVSSPVGSDVALSGRQVDFKIDGQQSQTGVLTWRPQKRGDATGLSLLSPRGLALLGLVHGETATYSTESGRTEFLEVVGVAEIPARTPAAGTGLDAPRRGTVSVATWGIAFAAEAMGGANA